MKLLPSAKDARIYMSIERTYLGGLRLTLVLIATGLYLIKVSTLLMYLYVDLRLSALAHTVAYTLFFLGYVAGFFYTLSFVWRLTHLEGGVEVSPKEVTDPRIYMAAERTFLAWVRTALALITVGFVVERFEFFLRQIELLLKVSFHGGYRTGAAIGLFIMLVGILAFFIGAFNFYRTVRDVDKGYYRTRVVLYMAYGILVLTACVVLTVHVLELLSLS